MISSYSAARIHAMRTKLIPNDTYERMLKMSAPEIINYLHETDYKKDIDDLQIGALEDLGMIDQVIARNTARELHKLQGIASPQYLQVLHIFLRRNDVWNLNVIADAIVGEASPSAALQQYARPGTFDPAAFTRAQSIPELSQLAAKQFPCADGARTLAQLRDALQQALSPDLEDAPATLKYLIDETNIMRLLLLRRDNIAPDEIMRRMQRGGTISVHLLRAAASAPDIAAAIEQLKRTTYQNIIDASAASSLIRFEAVLHKEVLRRIRRQSTIYPLHAELLLSYIAEKDIEHENIRLLVKGKRLGQDENFLRAHLIV